MKKDQKVVYKPKIGKRVFIHPSAVVEGRVKIGDDSSVWPNCVLRGDINTITIGKRTNIQDLTCIHLESNRGTKIADDVTVGHQVTLHACTIKRYALIGIQAIVLDGAVVGECCLVGAGTLVTHDQKLKPYSLYLGRPAKYVRPLTKEEIKKLKGWGKRYVKYAANYRKGIYRPFTPR
jgi:carbonic anhydrase/acetyltransferase-like protein (isoleucine patch superfamily)